MSHNIASKQDLQTVAYSTKENSHPARTAVFQITEILEMILDCLSFPDLATCQTINRSFLAAIQNSSLLRPKVSRETVRTETLRYIATSGGAFGFVIGPEFTERKLCPLLCLKPETNQWGVPSDCTPGASTTFSIEAYFNSEACWQNVYLTNPPTTEVWIVIRWRFETDEYDGRYAESRRIESEDGEGLTVGKLYKGLLRQRRWTAACGATIKGAPPGRGSYVCAREKTVAGSLARLEELTGLKAAHAIASCSVYFPRMIGALRRC